MSAFMCSDRHLTVLAAYAVRHELDDALPGTPAQRLQGAFSLLERANVASLDGRYPGESDGAFLGKLVRPDEPVEPIVLIKACHCYAYQACNSREWHESRAKVLCDRIEAHAVRHLPGYDEAPWGV